MDVTAGGNYKLGEIPRMKNSNFKADSYLFTLAESVATKLFGAEKVHKGRIISRDEFVASSEKVKKLREIFEAECVEMEGAYGIQEWIGHIGVTSIEGSYNNVMGLPTHLICQFVN